MQRNAAQVEAFSQEPAHLVVSTQCMARSARPDISVGSYSWRVLVCFPSFVGSTFLWLHARAARCTAGQKSPLLSKTHIKWVPTGPAAQWGLFWVGRRLCNPMKVGLVERGA